MPETDPKEGNLRGDGGGDERTRGGQPGIVDIVVGPGVSAKHDQCVRTDGGDRRRNHHRRGDPVGVGLHPDQLDPERRPPLTEPGRRALVFVFDDEEPHSSAISSSSARRTTMRVQAPT